jgi:hypothetical protein
LACPWPFHGPGNSAGVPLTFSQLPGNVAGPGTRIWRHSPVFGCSTEKEDAGVENVSSAPDATVYGVYSSAAARASPQVYWPQ